MGRFGIAVLLSATMLSSVDAFAQTTRPARFPRVYGATGRPYGPTQAHYQYEKQYGRPWHGHGGITANFGGNIGAQFVNGYPGSCLSSYGYSAYYHHGGCGFGFDGFIGPAISPFYSYTAPIPPVINGYPPVIGYHPLTDPVLNVPRLMNLGAGLNTPVDTEPLPPISTPEAKLKSMRAQAQGDTWFRQQEYHKAYDRYKAAVSDAPDRGEAHLRLAVVYTALGHLDLAVRQLKRGMAVDPQFTTKAEPLNKIFGEGNSIAQSAVVHKATLWTKEDVRDPDRLFLLGTLLYLQGDDRAKILLETGLMVGGGGDHFRNLLAAAENNPIEPADQAAAAGANPPAQPGANQPANPPEPPNPPAPADNGVLPPLPLPPASTPENPPQNPRPAGPELSGPNR